MAQPGRSSWRFRISTLLILVAVLALALKGVTVHMSKLEEMRRAEALAQANVAQARAALAQQRARLTPAGPAPLFVAPPANPEDRSTKDAEE
jgi:hypothetical protein